MNEMKKTMIFGGVALGLMLLAFVTAPSPVTPDAFLDQGEEFFPEFTDPNVATSLEVINFDEEAGEAVPFKVIFANGKWSIPSHYDYPADGKDRLSKTAASVMGIKKDDFRSDNTSDHEACGVIDPLDESGASLTGRGQRVTIKGENEVVLADFIVGNEIPDREGFRFVRVPEQRRVYAVRMDIDVSTKFSDWIEADLLQVDKSKLSEIILKDYSINERTRSVSRRDELVLTKNVGDVWSADRMRKDEEVDKTKMDDLVKNLDELTIVGIRPKPAGLSASLKRINDGGIEISQEAMFSLQSRGFYFAGDGSLLSNEGELQAETSDGVIYTLRFGEVAFGSGFDVSAGADEVAEGAPGENRYLFITTEFNDKAFKEPRQPRNTDFLSKADSLFTSNDHANKKRYDEYEKWKTDVQNGKELSETLNDRFANWYYVISSASFDKLNLTRSDLVKKKS